MLGARGKVDKDETTHRMTDAEFQLEAENNSGSMPSWRI